MFNSQSKGNSLFSYFTMIKKKPTATFVRKVGIWRHRYPTQSRSKYCTRTITHLNATTKVLKIKRERQLITLGFEFPAVIQVRPGNQGDDKPAESGGYIIRRGQTMLPCVVVLTELRGQYKSVARVTDYHALATSFLLYISKKEMHLAARRWSRGHISQTPAFVSNQSSSRSCWIIYTQVAMPFDTPNPPPLTTTIITFNRTAAIRPRCIQQTPLSDIFIPRLQDLI